MKVKKPRRLLACHPNFLMNLSHACIVVANPEAKGTQFFNMSDRSINYWSQVEHICADESDIVFYQEASTIMLSYARSISGAYRIWKSEIELAHKQFDVNEKQMTNMRVLMFKIGMRVVQSLFRLLMVMVFGYVLTLFLGKAFVPVNVSEATGVNLPATLGALSFGLMTMVVSTYYSNQLWSTAAGELSWCLGAAEEELERASIDAFDLHWSQFCRAYKIYSGKDYNFEPSFINIMRGKLRARERWNQRRLYRMTSNARVVITLMRRRLWAVRKRHVVIAPIA